LAVTRRAVNRVAEAIGVVGLRESRRVAWYWRLVAWVIAVPLGFVVAVVPSYASGLVTRNDVLDVFVGSGTDRYTRLALVAGLWVVATATLVHIFIEGGRWRASRRLARRQASGPHDGTGAGEFA
jgi:hypothetical protein